MGGRHRRDRRVAVADGGTRAAGRRQGAVRLRRHRVGPAAPLHQPRRGRGGDLRADPQPARLHDRAARRRPPRLGAVRAQRRLRRRLGQPVRRCRQAHRLLSAHPAPVPDALRRPEDHRVRHLRRPRGVRRRRRALRRRTGARPRGRHRRRRPGPGRGARRTELRGRRRLSRRVLHRSAHRRRPPPLLRPQPLGPRRRHERPRLRAGRRLRGRRDHVEGLAERGVKPAQRNQL